VPWLIPLRAMPSAYVCHNLFLCVLSLIPMSSITHSYVFHDSFIRVTNTNTVIYIRPTQSIMHVPLQGNRFQKIDLRIVQYNYLRSCSKHFVLQNLILRTKFCGTGIITQPIVFWISAWQKSVKRKWFVLSVYQFWKGVSAGPALKYLTWLIGAGG